MIETAESCDEAYEKLMASQRGVHFNVLILDISLPPSQDNAILSGEDFGLLVRKTSPETSIIIQTAHDDNYRIRNLIKNLNPEGFLIKRDITPEVFTRGLTTVLDEKIFYSQTVNQFIRKELTAHTVISPNDRKILFFLSQGVRTKHLVRHVPMSLPAIEKRKREMKELFEINEGGDTALIYKARELGFI